MRLARVINNSAALLMLDLLSKAVPLVVFPAVVRALGPTAYGKVGFATAVAGFFGLLASPGFTTYAAREAAKDEGRVNFLVQHVLGARIAFGVLSYALLIVFALTFAPHDFTTRLLIVLSGLIFLVSSVDVQWIFTARSRMWMVALRGAVGQLVYGGVILAFIRRPSDAWVVPVAGVASLVAGMFLIWLPARQEYRAPWPMISPRLARLSARMPDHGFRQHDVDDLRPDRYGYAALHAERERIGPLRRQLQHDGDLHVFRCNSRAGFFSVALRDDRPTPRARPRKRAALPGLALAGQHWPGAPDRDWRFHPSGAAHPVCPARSTPGRQHFFAGLC